MACSASSWIDLRNKKVAMENDPHQQSSPDHQDRKRSLVGVLLVVLTVALSIGLTVAWFTLIGYAVMALFGWIAA